MDSWNDDYMLIKSEPPNHTFTHFPHFKPFFNDLNSYTCAF
jgi:hypothetical protein